jgi:hypothetical protein
MGMEPFTSFVLKWSTTKDNIVKGIYLGVVIGFFKIVDHLFKNKRRSTHGSTLVITESKTDVFLGRRKLFQKDYATTNSSHSKGSKEAKNMESTKRFFLNKKVRNS